ALADWSDDFQSYTVGSQIIGQGGWEGWDGAAFPDAVVADDPAGVAGNKVLKLATNNDIVQQFPGYTSGAWVFKVKQYIAGTNNGDTFVILMNKYTSNSKGWGLTLRMDKNNLAVWDEHGNAEAIGGVVPVVYDQWVEVKVEVDLDANWHTTSYNGQVVGYGPWYDTGSADELKSIAAVDLWADVGGNPVYYDDASLTPGTPVVVVPPGQDITTHGTPISRYLVNLGQGFGDTVEYGHSGPTGVLEIASGGGNQSPWWRLNDGSPRGIMVTFLGGAPDYFGYRFKLPATVTHIKWDNYVFFDGGTFASTPEVQYLDAPNGTWQTHTDVTWDKPYNKVYNYGVREPADMNLSWGQRRYLVTLNNPPANIWGIRLFGEPEPGVDDREFNSAAFGSPGTGFVGVTEMTLYGSVNVGNVDITNNLALVGNGGVPFARRCQQGDPGIARINDGLFSASADSFGGRSPTGEDWIGVTWPTPQNNVTAVGMTFAGFKDGGYFGNDLCGVDASVRVEYTTDGENWTPVSGLDAGRYPAVARKLQALQWGPDTAWLLRFDPVSGITGIRIIGDPSGFVTTDGDGFLGWLELEVFPTAPQVQAGK
ncbi:MAG: hypothetical protein HRF43_20020, partial [Phycisphaerae bacterium]